MRYESYEAMTAHVTNGQHIKWFTRETPDIITVSSIEQVGIFKTPDGPAYTDLQGKVINSTSVVTYVATAEPGIDY